MGLMGRGLTRHYDHDTNETDQSYRTEFHNPPGVFIDSGFSGGVGFSEVLRAHEERVSNNTPSGFELSDPLDEEEARLLEQDFVTHIRRQNERGENRTALTLLVDLGRWMMSFIFPPTFEQLEKSQSQIVLEQKQRIEDHSTRMRVGGLYQG